MLVSTLFDQINGAYRGSDDDAPTTGTDYTLWLNTTNRKISEWAGDDKNVWKSLFLYEKPNEPGTVLTTGTTTLTGTDTYFTDYKAGDTITVSGETVRIIDTITSNTVLTVTVAFSNTASGKTYTHVSIIEAGVQTYSLHRSFMYPSDKTFVSTTTQDIEYMIGKPQERSRYNNEVYISGKHPQTITFYDDIETDSNLVGGTLKVPGYYAPNDLTASTDTVPVDDPYWLVYAVASELAFNDLTYSDKSPDLNAKANNLYSGMISTNRRGSNNTPRVARTNVERIRGPHGESANIGSPWSN